MAKPETTSTWDRILGCGVESRHAMTSLSHNEDIGIARKLVIKGASDSGCQISSGETVVVAIRGSRGSVRPSHSFRPPWAATEPAITAG